MRTFGPLMLIATASLLHGCASTTPNQLIDARRAYEVTSAGPAAEWAPAELHDAEQALARAETEFEKDADSFRTVDLAYVAQRKAEVAAVQASILMEQAAQVESNKEFSNSQREMLADQKAELGEVRHSLALSEQSHADLTQRLDTEQDARRDAEQRSEQAETEISKIGEIENGDRGTVITLPEIALFRVDETVLMPGAEQRLDLVVAAMEATSNRNVVVEGHSDSDGSEAANFTLTQARADAIRDYLIGQGCPANLVQARGMGEGHPVADNATAQGRSDNRRFAIIIEPASK